MACGSCKGNKTPIVEGGENNAMVKVLTSTNYVIKFGLFLFTVCLLPLVLLIGIVILFNSIVLGRSTISVSGLIDKMKNRNKSEEVEDEEEDEVNPEDYELTDVEVVK